MTRGGSSRLGSLSSMSWTYLLGRAIGCLSAAALLVFVISKLVRARRRRLMLDGRGRGVLVTGCDSGFGYQLARRLDQRGFAVFAGCLFPDGDGARSLGQQCSGKLKVLKLDVRSDADVEQAKAAVLQNLPEKGECGALWKGSRFREEQEGLCSPPLFSPQACGPSSTTLGFRSGPRSNGAPSRTSPPWWTSTCLAPSEPR